MGAKVGRRLVLGDVTMMKLSLAPESKMAWVGDGV